MRSTSHQRLSEGAGSTADTTRRWRSANLQGRDSSGSVVLDAFWTQLLTDDHLAEAPGTASEARPTTESRYLLQIGPTADWLGSPTREEQREVGLARLEGCLVNDEASRLERGRQLFREWKASQPTPQDDPPPWALPVTPPQGMTRSRGQHCTSLVGPGIEEFTERFDAPDGRRLTVRQSIPADRPSAGDPSTEIAPGRRVQEAGTPPHKPSRSVFWSEHGRTLRVAVNDAITIDLHGIVVRLHELARQRVG